MSSRRWREPHWLLVWAVSTAFGFVAAGLDVPVWASVLVGVAVLGAVLLLIGER